MKDQIADFGLLFFSRHNVFISPKPTHQLWPCGHHSFPMEDFRGAFREAVILIWVKKDDQWVPYAAGGFMNQSCGPSLSAPSRTRLHTVHSAPSLEDCPTPLPKMNISTNIWDSLESCVLKVYLLLNSQIAEVLAVTSLPYMSFILRMVTCLLTRTTQEVLPVDSKYPQA